MTPKGLKGKPGDEFCCLAPETASAGGRFADHQVKGRSTILDVKICKRAAANQLLIGTDTFIQGECEHLGCREALAYQAFNLFATEWLVAMAGEAYKLRVGVPTL